MPLIDLPTQDRKVRSPITYGICAGLCYFVLFCCIPWIIQQFDLTLFWLSVWGSLYFAFAVTIARTTSSSVLRHIESNVLPVLSEKAALAIEEDLARRFRPMRISVVSVGAALVATVASVAAIRLDLFAKIDIASAPWIKILYWSAGYFVLYLTAARATDVARFYGTFAAHLRIDTDQVFTLDPAKSVLVTQIAAIGRYVFLFWFWISLSVVALFIFLKFSELRLFVLLVVPIASFFSIGVGTVVFLTSEHRIREVVDEVAALALRSTELEIASLFNRRPQLDTAGWSQLKELMSLQKHLADSGWYRSITLGVLSILTPFAGPVVSILLWALTQKAAS
jgi:hypothetical protein